jgi:hypothetical protein
MLKGVIKEVSSTSGVKITPVDGSLIVRASSETQMAPRKRGGEWAMDVFPASGDDLPAPGLQVVYVLGSKGRVATQWAIVPTDEVEKPVESLASPAIGQAESKLEAVAPAKPECTIPNSSKYEKGNGQALTKPKVVVPWDVRPYVLKAKPASKASLPATPYDQPSTAVPKVESYSDYFRVPQFDLPVATPLADRERVTPARLADPGVSATPAEFHLTC